MYIKFEELGIKRSPLLYVSAETKEITMVNKWASILFDDSKENLIGRNFFFWMDKKNDSIGFIEEMAKNIFKNRINWRGFVKGVRRNKSYWVELSATYIPSNKEFSIVLNEPSELDLKKLLES